MSYKPSKVPQIPQIFFRPMSVNHDKSNMSLKRNVYEINNRFKVSYLVRYRRQLHSQDYVRYGVVQRIADDSSECSVRINDAFIHLGEAPVETIPMNFLKKLG